MLDYLKQWDDKFTKPEDKEEMKATVRKMEDLLKKFGFKFSHSFNMISKNYKREDTTWFYRFEIGEHEYIEVQIGWLYDYSKYYGRGRNKKQYVRGQKGVFRVHNHKVSLNPETGKPWQIGDTVTHESGCYSVTLTKRGWYSGD